MVVIALAVAVGAGSNPASAAPPTPGADAFHVNCGETVSISDAQLLANDTDPDGDAVQSAGLGVPSGSQRGLHVGQRRPVVHAGRGE